MKYLVLHNKQTDQILSLTIEELQKNVQISDTVLNDKDMNMCEIC